MLFEGSWPQNVSCLSYSHYVLIKLMESIARMGNKPLEIYNHYIKLIRCWGYAIYVGRLVSTFTVVCKISSEDTRV